MAKSFPMKLAALFALAGAALIAAACSGGEKEGDVSNPGSDAPSGLSVTLYASPT
ncbi:MAG TPA: hypothetical protein VFP63_03165 [Dehalococcoidia bacterium]|nr:hypothetical protein [Dehalococcoidia bacterium]